MHRLRALRRFIRLLVGLFLVAQLAGVVSSPRADASPHVGEAASHLDHQHMHQHGDQAVPHDQHDQAGKPADTCCALHAYFAGVLPLAIAFEVANAVGEALSVGIDDLIRGLPPGRLDRPPRPLL